MFLLDVFCPFPKFTETSITTDTHGQSLVKVLYGATPTVIYMYNVTYFARYKVLHLQR